VDLESILITALLLTHLDTPTSAPQICKFSSKHVHLFHACHDLQVEFVCVLDVLDSTIVVSAILSP